MRQIKYKLWDIHSKVMIQPSSINFGDDGSALTIIIEVKDVNGFSLQYVVGESCELIEYTGIKDKNGKEIYEGYIVMCEGKKYFIRFEYGSFMLCDNHDMFEFEGISFANLACDKKEIEIIGNIYEQ